MQRLVITALTATLIVASSTLMSRTRGAESTDGVEVVALTHQTSHPLVLAGDAQDVYLHVALRAADLPHVARPSMNLALVIDRSGSMASEDKLTFAKSAAEQLVGRLEPDDRLAIVAYDHDIRTVVPSTPARERGVFLAAIRGLHTGGSTDLHGGMVTGYDEVRAHFDEERLNRVLLLSDGLANRGVTQPDAIRSRAAQCRETGVRISTMGMGLSYDEDLLSGIAHHAGGNYYYVREAESVGRHLDRELDELTRIVARDVEVRVELGEGVQLGEIYGYSHTRKGSSIRIPVSDLYSGERRKVVVRLRVQGAAGTERALATASLRYVDSSSHTSHRQSSATLRSRFTDDIDEVLRSRRLDVLIKVEIVHNAGALDAAMKLQRDGEIDAAQELLDARYRNSKLVNDTEYRSAELTRMLETMKQVLFDIERTRGDASARRDLQLTTELQALGYTE